MSKASEWAAAPTWPRNDLILGNDPHGHFQASPVLFPSRVECGIRKGYHDRVYLSQAEALTLARWILDTFGEPDGSA